MAVVHVFKGGEAGQFFLAAGDAGKDRRDLRTAHGFFRQEFAVGVAREVGGPRHLHGFGQGVFRTGDFGDAGIVFGEDKLPRGHGGIDLQLRQLFFSAHVNGAEDAQIVVDFGLVLRGDRRSRRRVLSHHDAHFVLPGLGLKEEGQLASFRLGIDDHGEAAVFFGEGGADQGLAPIDADAGIGDGFARQGIVAGLNGIHGKFIARRPYRGVLSGRRRRVVLPRGHYRFRRSLVACHVFLNGAAFALIVHQGDDVGHGHVVHVFYAFFKIAAELQRKIRAIQGLNIGNDQGDDFLLGAVGFRGHEAVVVVRQITCENRFVDMNGLVYEKGQGKCLYIGFVTARQNDIEFHAVAVPCFLIMGRGKIQLRFNISRGKNCRGHK